MKKAKKLSKLVLEQLTEAETMAIKAGSGQSDCTTPGKSSCSGSDHCKSDTDSC